MGRAVTGDRNIANEALTAYEFKTGDGDRSRVETWTPASGGASSVQIYKGKQPLLAEPFLASSVSRPVRGQP